MATTLQLFEGGVVEHELALAAVVGEADSDESACLDVDDDAFPERRVPNVVAGREARNVLLAERPG